MLRAGEWNATAEETLAKLVEATAKDPQDAARIIREAIPKQ